MKVNAMQNATINNLVRFGLALSLSKEMHGIWFMVFADYEH